MMMNWEREQWRVCGIVGVFKMDWGCGRRIVEVYKRLAERISQGHHYFVTLHLGRLANNCRGARECVV